MSSLCPSTEFEKQSKVRTKNLPEKCAIFKVGVTEGALYYTLFEQLLQTIGAVQIIDFTKRKCYYN